MLSAGLTAYSVRLAVRCRVSAVVTRHPNLAKAVRHRIRRPHADPNDAINIVTASQISRQPGLPPPLLGKRAQKRLPAGGVSVPTCFTYRMAGRRLRACQYGQFPPRHGAVPCALCFFFFFPSTATGHPPASFTAESWAAIINKTLPVMGRRLACFGLQV